jgi:hypothetical protein
MVFSECPAHHQNVETTLVERASGLPSKKDGQDGHLTRGGAGGGEREIFEEGRPGGPSNKKGSGGKLGRGIFEERRPGWPLNKRVIGGG